MNMVLHGPPARCAKCKKTSFDRIDWPNKDGTAESAFFCSGCGRVSAPVPIDVMANLRKALEDTGFAASLAASAFSNSAQWIVRQYADEEMRQYAERARAPFQETAQAARTFAEETAATEQPVRRRDPYQRQNWKATQQRHARRHKGSAKR
jgi:hypothetical protein